MRRTGVIIDVLVVLLILSDDLIHVPGTYPWQN